MSASDVADMIESATLMRYEIKVHYSNIKSIANKYMYNANKRDITTQDVATLKYSLAKIRELTQKINVTEQMSSTLQRLNCEKTLIDSERKLLKHVTPLLKHIRKKRKHHVGKSFEKDVDKFLDYEHYQYPVASYLEEIGNSNYDDARKVEEFTYGDILKYTDVEDKSLHDFLSEIHANNLTTLLPNVPTENPIEKANTSQINYDKLT